MIISDDTARQSRDVLVATTPRAMKAMLAKKRAQVSAVVLTGPLAGDCKLATFLHDAYPTLQVVSGPDPYLPAFA
jgi:hypothetical protein